MTAQLIDGKKVAADIRGKLKTEIEELKSKGIHPGLAVVLVGRKSCVTEICCSKRKGLR